MPCCASKCVAICLTSQKTQGSQGFPGPPWRSFTLRVHSKLGGSSFGTPGFSRAQVRQPSITASWVAYPSPLRTEETLLLTGLSPWATRVPAMLSMPQAARAQRKADQATITFRSLLPWDIDLEPGWCITFYLHLTCPRIRAREELVLRFLRNCLSKARHMCVYRYMYSW